MKCDKIKDILYTGYFDGELSDSDRVMADKHMEECSACRALASDIKSVCIDVFEGAEKKITAPEGIFDILAGEAQKNTLLRRIYEYLRYIFAFPKVLVPVFAGVLLAVFIFTKDSTDIKDTSNIPAEENNTDYFSYVFNGESIQSEEADYVSVEFGSVIEEYLF